MEHKNAQKFKKENESKYNTTIITNKDELTFEKVKLINPEYILFPHWSWIIPKEIFENFTCVVFHMTDLPFGREEAHFRILLKGESRKQRYLP